MQLVTHEIFIRPFNSDDADAMAALFKASVLELGRRFYNHAQVIAWAARGPSPERIKARNKQGLHTWVAVNANIEILAYGELESDGHIDQLYARPDVAGMGVVSKLYDELERVARDLELNRLYTEASEGARRFFFKKDFTEIGRKDFKIGGVSIHNYEMEKQL